MTNTETTNKLFNLELINQSLSFVDSVAKSTTTKNTLLSDTFFDYLAKKQDVKTTMVEAGIIDPKNKEIANYYFKGILSALTKKAFEAYNIEIKEVIKEDKEFNYTFTNKSTTTANGEFIVAFKELFKLYKTLIQLISTNNLSLRIKLLDYKKVKNILDNLSNEFEHNGVKTTLKSAINSIDKNSNDIDYIKALDNFIKLSKEVKKSDFSTIKKSVEKISLDDKKALLAFLQSEIKKEEEKTTLEDTQNPASANYSIDE